MKILIFWDIYWRVWRKAFLKEFKNLKQKYEADFCIACVDNLSSGRWAIEKHAVELEKAWVDLMTSWDHFFDNISKISFSSNLIPTFFLFNVGSFGAGIVTISIDLLIKEMEYPFFL